MTKHRTRIAVVGGLLALSPGLVIAQGTNPQVQQPQTSESMAMPSMAPLVDSVKAAVVNVDVEARGNPREFVGQQPGQQDEGEGDNPFGFTNPHRRGGGRNEIHQGMGSGTIIDAQKGYILTNSHVVEGAVSIRVRLDDGRSFDAQTVGRDPLTDVALIKIKGKFDKLPAVKLGDSDAIRVGDWALAIGNPFGLASSVSVGIISARARQIGASLYDDFIQTDAAINPGNSGGPLFNMKGEVIGINTAIIGGGAGIGFAVPSNLAKAILPQLETAGSVTRGYLGVGIQTVTPSIARAMSLPTQDGAVVTQVTEGGPATKAGVKRDDVVVAIDGQKIISSDALTRIVALKRPGSTVALTLFRDGKKQDVKVALGTRPDLEKLGGRDGAPGAKGSQEDEGRKLKIGLAMQDMDPRFAQGTGLPAEGALITEVTPGSPAEHADLMRGMVVIEAARKPVKSATDLMKAIKAAKSGSSLLLRVQLPNSEGTLLRALEIP